MERFLENYTHGLMNFQAEARLTVRNEVVYTVSALKGSDLYTIRSSRCPCKELERTGVPCAHLLSAMMTAKVSYTELISARWMIRHPLGKSEWPHCLSDRLTKHHLICCKPPNFPNSIAMNHTITILPSNLISKKVGFYVPPLKYWTALQSHQIFFQNGARRLLFLQ